jgi:endonuclease YncB( thermonuclease family)
VIVPLELWDGPPNFVISFIHSAAITTKVFRDRARRRGGTVATHKKAQNLRYTLIRGSYYILYPDLPKNGPQPDGDTINFLPDNEDLITELKRFANRSPERKHLGTYSVRFEGIDALETHFMNRHQKLAQARAARDRMLALMGFGAVAFWPELPNNVKSAQYHPVRGCLIANGIESNGRVLGLVYPGEIAAGTADGQRIFVDRALLDASVNAKLVSEGLAYAELYSTMPLSLLGRMRQVVKAARNAGLGFWPQENVQLGTPADITDLSDLPNMVMFPKLYRRLVKYFDSGFIGLAAFDAWIRADSTTRDDRALLPTQELGNLHDLYDIGANGIQLQFLPEDLTFESA